jgi:CBS-domain-containing membrane protein
MAGTPREGVATMATLTCSDIMKVNLRTIREDDELECAAIEMSRDEIHHLLVVDKEGKLVGIISDRDLLKTADWNGMRVATVMERDVTVVGPGTPAAHAVERMMRAKYSALPVVDDRRHPIGVVTSTDFLDIAYRALVGIELRAHRARA